MGTLQNLNDAAMAARRKSMTREPGGEHAAYFSWVLGEIMRKAKNALRPATDQDAEEIMRTEIKAMTRALEGDAAKGIAPLPDSDFRTTTQAKRDAIDALLPKQIEGEALAEAIRVAGAEADVVISPAAMGKIMGVLKAKYPGLIDGAQVKALLEHGV